MLEMELQCTQDPGAMEPGMDMEFWRIHPPGRDTWAHGMKVQFSFWRYHIMYPLEHRYPFSLFWNKWKIEEGGGIVLFITLGQVRWIYIGFRLPKD